MKVPQQEVQKIIIFRALQLGDLLCSIPAIRALRQAYPQASVTLAGLPWAKAFVERFSGYFDAFIPFPGYPGLPEQAVQPAAFTSFLAEVQAEKFDLALQMQGNGTLVNPMIELFGARYTAGFCVSHDYCPNKELFLEYPNHGHEIERHIRLMNHLGIEEQGLQLEFPLSGKDYEEFAELNLPVDPMHYVCIHPGSRGSWRQWPPKYCAELADYCKKQGFEVTDFNDGDMKGYKLIKKIKNIDDVSTSGKESFDITKFTNGEEKYLFKYQDQAEVIFNTFIAY